MSASSSNQASGQTVTPTQSPHHAPLVGGGQESAAQSGSGQRLIVNCLPLTPSERAMFETAAAGIRQVFTGDELLADRGGNWSAQIPQPLRQEVTAIIGNVAPAVVSQCPRLRWLQTWSAGTDQYAKPRVLPADAVVTNASGAYGQVVSEHMFALMWALMKNLHSYSADQHDHRWGRAIRATSPRHGTALVIGTGDIGSHFAQLAKAVGMHTQGVRRHAGKPARGIDEMYDFSQLDALLPGADVVALVVPSAPDTHHLLDARRLGLLNADAIVINAGRGDAIDAVALADALHSGALRGAGIDVTEPEPLASDSPLWDEPGCIITPHVAGYHLPDTRHEIIRIILNNLVRYVAGTLGTR